MPSANVIMKSRMELWQIPRNVYRMMPVTYAELYQRVRPYGEIGRYLVENLIEFNNEGDKRSAEYRVLGDSPAIGVILYELAMYCKKGLKNPGKISRQGSLCLFF